MNKNKQLHKGDKIKQMFKQAKLAKMIAALFVPLLVISALQGQGENGGKTNSIDELRKKVFKNTNDSVIKGNGCSWECRDVNDGYATQISGFDFKSARTFCKVYQSSDLTYDLGIDAGQRNLSCKMKDFESEYNKFKDGGKNNVNIKSSIEFKQDEKNITMTKVLTGLVTLNPNIIDRQQTKDLGEITLKDGVEPFSTMNYTKNWKSETHKHFLSDIVSGSADIGRKIIADTFLEKIGYDAIDKAENFANEAIENIPAIPTKTISYENSSALDGFNKNNMAYFSDLFLANEKIYQHLQIFLFMLVGGFFVTQIGAKKLQAYLENRGESSGKEPYLHKFYIPLIMVGTFFMPIPEANGTAHSTIMQNVIRYFTIHSTNLADMAGSIGAKTYMDKIYKSIGGVGNDGIGNIVFNKYLNNFIIEEGNKIYGNTCQKRYGEKLNSYNTSSLKMYSISDEEKERLRKISSELDPNGIAGTKDDISFEACVGLEVEIQEAMRKNDRLQMQLDGIERFQNTDSISKKINDIDKYFTLRNKQLGWADSILVPSSAILAETFVFSNDHIVKENMRDSTKNNIKNRQRAINDGDLDAGGDDISDSFVGFIGGQLVWMMLPGSGAVKDFIAQNDGIFARIFGSYAGGKLGSGFNFFDSSLTGAISGAIAGGVSKTITSWASAILLIQWTFDKVPLLVCTTASLIAFVSYLVSLCKYFYISPFVVAWGMATRQMNKIIEFFISGIAIFLKPVLIVLFIYLSLFLYTIIDEFFIFLSIEQFSGIETSSYNFHTNFIIGAISGLLVIFGKLSSSYIMWKLIISGASWALSLVGIDGKQDEVIASGIESNLARRAFVA